jgi:acetolactate synthase-1/2/3 large subunit
VIFGIGCSFVTSNFGVPIPRNKVIVHATLDPADLGRCLPIDYGLTGDAGLTLDALLAEVRERLAGQPRGRAARIAQEIAGVREEWRSRETTPTWRGPWAGTASA